MISVGYEPSRNIATWRSGVVLKVIYLSLRSYLLRFQLQGMFTSEEMQRYSKKFLCGMYIMAHGNVNNNIKALDVFFENVSPAAYERPSYGYQATNEIVQDLIQKGFIERNTLEYIRLTQKGLDKCKEDCH
jgi:hypothetical protein